MQPAFRSELKTTHVQKTSAKAYGLKYKTEEDDPLSPQYVRPTLLKSKPNLKTMYYSKNRLYYWFHRCILEDCVCAHIKSLDEGSCYCADYNKKRKQFPKNDEDSDTMIEDEDSTARKIASGLGSLLEAILESSYIFMFTSLSIGNKCEC
jgi:hypothetical protein